MRIKWGGGIKLISYTTGCCVYRFPLTFIKSIFIIITFTTFTISIIFIFIFIILSAFIAFTNLNIIFIFQFTIVYYTFNFISFIYRYIITHYIFFSLTHKSSITIISFLYGGLIINLIINMSNISLCNIF